MKKFLLCVCLVVFGLSSSAFAAQSASKEACKQLPKEERQQCLIDLKTELDACKDLPTLQERQDCKATTNSGTLDYLYDTGDIWSFDSLGVREDEVDPDGHTFAGVVFEGVVTGTVSVKYIPFGVPGVYLEEINIQPCHPVLGYCTTDFRIDVGNGIYLQPEAAYDLGGCGGASACWSFPATTDWIKLSVTPVFISDIEGVEVRAYTSENPVIRYYIGSSSI